MCKQILLAALLTALGSTSSVARQAIDSRAAFERLKTLSGTWDATEPGNPKYAEVVTYTMTGRGTVLIEDMKAPADVMGHMLTSYHLDVDTLVLTHYCGAGNQPRMRIVSSDARAGHVAFEIYDITNLKDRDAYYSKRVDVKFISDDRVDLTYTGSAGKKEYVQVFHLTRRRP